MSDTTPPAKWREDFPVRWENDNYITRREFTKFLVLTSGATCAGNGFFVLKMFQEREATYPSTAIATVDSIQAGTAKLFRYPTENDPAMLIRLQDGSFVAYLQRCTHLSCPVLFNDQTVRLECPCHNGVFDVRTGMVLEGPPPRPLPRIRLRVEGGQIYADGVESTDRNEEGAHA